MNIQELERAYAAARERLHAASRAIDEAGDTDDLDALNTELGEAADEAERTRANLDEGERIQRALDAHPLPADTSGAAGAQSGGVARGQLRHELAYRPDTPSVSFLRDAYSATFGHSSDAAERLQRNEGDQQQLFRERFGREMRDVGTGAFAGLTIPQFLLDLYAPAAKEGRPLANRVRHLPLPDSGMVISISRITTETTVAVQAAENDAVSETNIDDTKLDVDVRTIAGMQDVSRQALERSEMVEPVVIADLVGEYHTLLDSQILNGAGSSGTHLGIRNVSGINAVTYTDASPTLAEAYPKIADALQQIDSGRFLPATLIVVHPRRWAKWASELDTTNRPLVVPAAGFNPVGTGGPTDYGNIVGYLFGLQVLTDANIPTTLGSSTNEDILIAGRESDWLLWEEGDGTPRRLRFEQTLGGNLTVKLVVYGYSAFTAGRYPEAAATVGGTGMAAPTF